MEEKDNGSLITVYRLNFIQCDSVYVGETGLKFSVRMMKQVNGDDKSWFGKHCNEEQHASQPVEQSFEIIRIENNVRKRRLMEQMEILKVKKEKKHTISSTT
jgi:hypothetical protein